MKESVRSLEAKCLQVGACLKICIPFLVHESPPLTLSFPCFILLAFLIHLGPRNRRHPQSHLTNSGESSGTGGRTGVGPALGGLLQAQHPLSRLSAATTLHTTPKPPVPRRPDLHLAWQLPAPTL